MVNFPMDLSIRIWDNLLAYGTRFHFNICLSILETLEHRLIDMNMVQLIEFFKTLAFDVYHDEDNQIQRTDSQADLKTEVVEKEVLNIEHIIERAQTIYIPSERLKALFEKHKMRQPLKPKAKLDKTKKMLKR